MLFFLRFLSNLLGFSDLLIYTSLSAVGPHKYNRQTEVRKDLCRTFEESSQLKAKIKIDFFALLSISS